MGNLVFVGGSYTFQVLFLDEFGVPLVVSDPTISIFCYSLTGIRQVLVDAAPMQEVIPAEVGRYTYRYTIPDAVVPGVTLHAEMRATDPAFDQNHFVVEDTVDITSPYSLASSSGLVSRFVKGG